MQIWDTGGDRRFRNVSRAYLRGSHVILIFFDLSNRDSWEESLDICKLLAREIDCKERSNRQLVYMVGSKADIGEKQHVSALRNEIGPILQEELGLKYRPDLLLCSSKQNTVGQMFDNVAAQFCFKPQFEGFESIPNSARTDQQKVAFLCSS